jgi:glycosyltransferase involved in cell wall biosynthesis
MKLVLILMVRNESRILERCLTAVKDVVDAFCIHDTGSTDNTREIARDFLVNGNYKGSVTESEWKNFGFNRTASFEAAHTFVTKSTDWDPKDTYGLLLDADMIFHPGTLKEQVLTEIGYTIIQCAGHLEYPNCRLVRMDYPWKCLGVTHEYWDGACAKMDKSVCWIEDQNDGGCKADKFERDARLLEEGLKENPKNERYMFYLAQTYHSLGRWKDSIAMYKKRYDAGGWDEERWYSLYMIADSYLKLNEPLKFEMYMQKAMHFRPGRAEAPYALTKYFREKGDHHKAWFYLLRGRSLPLSTDSLFIEKPVYMGKFDYEATILLYYIGKPEEGLRESMKYLLTKSDHLDSVYQNMSFYVKPLGTPVTNHPVPRDAAGPDFHPTSVSFFGNLQNVRFVNYVIDYRNGSYTMREGTYSPDTKVRTRNVLWDGKTAVLMDESNTGLTLLPHRIEGLEDVRVYPDSLNTLCFVATCAQVGPKIRMVQGDYNLGKRALLNCKVLEPPTDTDCEKNWLPIPLTNSLIYKWHPLQIGVIKDDKLEIRATHSTPWFFRHLRGSAIPIRVGTDLLVLAHYVEYSQPRKYFHCIVALDAEDYTPLRVTLPFTFKATGIEYCLGWKIENGDLTFAFSSWDDNPCMTTVPFTRFEWIAL